MCLQPIVWALFVSVYVQVESHLHTELQRRNGFYLFMSRLSIFQSYLMSNAIPHPTTQHKSTDTCVRISLSQLFFSPSTLSWTGQRTVLDADAGERVVGLHAVDECFAVGGGIRLVQILQETRMTHYRIVCFTDVALHHAVQNGLLRKKQQPADGSRTDSKRVVFRLGAYRLGAYMANACCLT